MTRVKRGTIASKTRRNVLKKVKGFRFGRSTKEIMAHEALVHAGKYSFAHRKDKKNDFRRLWTVRINAAIRPHGLSYSKFINILKLKNIEIDRKVMSDIADKKPESFKRIVEFAMAK
jgi:large subunit ribosomal protein L20